jgi:hypothetical protein
MPAIARVVKRVAHKQFDIYCEDVLVANVADVSGLDEAIAVTKGAGVDPSVYVSGLHVTGPMPAAAFQWFLAWRGTGVKRDLKIRDHSRGRTILISGAFISAWSDGSWYDLVIDAAVLDVKGIDP